MKILFTLILCFFFSFSKAQDTTQNYLENAGRQLQNGFLYSVAGVGVTTMGVLFLTPNDETDIYQQRFVMYAGMGISIIGVVNMYSGFVNIKRAGAVLRKKGLLLSGDKVVYRF